MKLWCDRYKDRDFEVIAVFAPNYPPKQLCVVTSKAGAERLIRALQQPAPPFSIESKKHLHHIHDRFGKVCTLRGLGRSKYLVCTLKGLSKKIT